MGREARAREERTPIERLEQSVVDQMVNLEGLLKQGEDAHGERHAATLAALQQLGALIATQVSQATIDSLPTYTLTICGLKVLQLKPK